MRNVSSARGPREPVYGTGTYRLQPSRIFTTLVFEQNGCYQLLLHFLAIFHSNPCQPAAINCHFVYNISVLQIFLKQPTPNSEHPGVKIEHSALKSHFQGMPNSSTCIVHSLPTHLTLRAKKRPRPHDMHAYRKHAACDAGPFCTANARTPAKWRTRD